MSQNPHMVHLYRRTCHVHPYHSVALAVPACWGTNCFESVWVTRAANPGWGRRGLLFSGAFCFAVARSHSREQPLCSIKVLSVPAVSIFNETNGQWNSKSYAAPKNVAQSIFVREVSSHSCEWLQLNIEKGGTRSLGLP